MDCGEALWAAANCCSHPSSANDPLKCFLHRTQPNDRSQQVLGSNFATHSPGESAHPEMLELQICLCWLLEAAIQKPREHFPGCSHHEPRIGQTTIKNISLGSWPYTFIVHLLLSYIVFKWFQYVFIKRPGSHTCCTRSPWTPAAADVSHCGEKQGHSLHQWLLEWLDKPPHSIDLEPLPAWREICPPDRQDIVKSQAHASLKHSSCNPCQPILQLGLERQDLKALLLEANAWHLPGQIH